jgi:type IV secretory pathway VirB2 component (pilin)
MNALLKFFKQPLNQAALAGVAATGLAVLQGAMTWQHAVPVAVGAVVALVLPDNSVAKEDIEGVVAAAIKTVVDMQKVGKG